MAKAGTGAIPADVYKKGGKALTARSHQMFLLMWEQETIPQRNQRTFHHTSVQA
ncbi:hypothetical protein DPMN_120185 [Dreissena polymorpha]|uniref:Uncharacterized protein n=1 Tax=Dreissena polymorpha TaxID=45954 RepID=A0A9D4JPX4_DREPO|nr:hypothetical protein DPMN_120185 [Dreissena polymorpha]